MNRAAKRCSVVRHEKNKSFSLARPCHVEEIDLFRLIRFIRFIHSIDSGLIVSFDSFDSFHSVKPSQQAPHNVVSPLHSHTPISSTYCSTLHCTTLLPQHNSQSTLYSISLFIFVYATAQNVPPSRLESSIRTGS